MIGYVVRRCLYVVPILAGVNLVVFILFFLVNSPTDMARQALGDKASTPEQVHRWQEARGYHLPRFYNHQASGGGRFSQTIFFRKSLALFWGDFGESDMTLRPIGQEIRRRVLPSLALTVPMFLGTLLLNIVLAMQLAAARDSWFDRGGQLVCVLLMSVSTLIYIIAGQYLIAGRLKLVPVSGFAYGWTMLKFLILPVLVGITAGMAPNIRLYRTLFLEEIGRDYVRTARAKGLPEGTVLYRHVLRNALIPILTQLPVQILMLIMGNLLLENFFSIPGLGGYTIQAVAAQDFAVVRAMVFLGAVLYIAGQLIADLCYGLADPRIRLR